MAKKVKVAARKPTVFASISDLHIGYQSIDQITKEYFDEDNGFFKGLELVKEYCDENNFVFGGLAICGDYFDHQLSLNSLHAKFAMDLMHAILNTVVTMYEGTVVLIQGTRGHDLNQINIFEPFLHEYEGSFHIINTVEAIEVADYKILCIPEEYMQDQESYYADAFSKKYDIIWGHGFFKFNCFNTNVVERPVPEMPIFNQEEIVKIARLTIFGHDHRNQEYHGPDEGDGEIHYNGSYSRLCHGEEYTKGFLMSYIDDDTVEVTMVENDLAPSFLSVNLEKLVKGEIDYEIAVKAIRKAKTKVDFLKVKISKEFVMENPTMVELIKAVFSSQHRKGIEIDTPAFTIKDGKPVLLCKENLDEESDDVEVIDLEEEKKEESELSFLFDPTIYLDEKVERFINIKHEGKLSDEMHISLDDIRNAISSPKG